MKSSVRAVQLRRRARRRSAAAVVVALSGAAAGCGDDPVQVTDDVVGTWTAVSENGAQQYIRIAEEEIEVFSEDLLGDCFERVLYEILETDGDLFRITDETHEFSIELRRDGEELQVTAFDVVLNYTRTDVDPAALPLCPAPNPGVACSELRLLALATEVVGDLDASDPRNLDGSHYDLYRLQVDAGLDLVLEMTSNEIDSYLILFDEDGDVVAENDDASALTLNARIAPALEAGCYILMATSAGPAEFGDYTIEAARP